jgi:hypothetical protein
MPDPIPDAALDRLLEFRETLPSDAFVLDVMHRVQRRQRNRKLILYAFGLVGAGFGAVGALMLSGPITRLFANLPMTGTMQVSLITVAAVAFYGWFMNEDISLDT